MEVDNCSAVDAVSCAEATRFDKLSVGFLENCTVARPTNPTNLTDVYVYVKIMSFCGCFE